MPAAQIYSMVNTIANNIGYTGTSVVDATSFAIFAKSALTGAKESVYNALYDVIGKTIVAIDVAKEGNDRGLIVDSFTYGSILQKLNFQSQAAETASEWDIANPENPYTVVGKGGIIPKYFEQTMPAFCWKDVSYERQIIEAFHSPESFAGFTEGLFQRMRNQYNRSKKGLADTAVGSLIASIYADTTDMNATRRVRHLLTEYNGTYGTSLTSATSLVDPGYLEYVRQQMILIKKNFDEYTHLYNTIGASGSEVPIDRRTSEEDLHIDLSVALTAAYDKYWSLSYNEQYVSIPNHYEVVNWGEATAPQSIDISLDNGGTTISVDNIIGLMYDKDSVVCTLDRERFVNIYDQWNDRNVFKLEAERRFIVDPTENAVVLLND